MLCVFWGVASTPVFEFLPPGTTMTLEVFSQIVVEPLCEIAKGLPKDKYLYVHWDNARVHTAKIIKERMKATNLILLPQPPYSPEVAPSDFFLFGYLKNQLKGEPSKTIDELY
jgi:hypothetical protein